MKLRPKIALTIVALLVPLAFAFAMGQQWWEKRLFEGGMSHATIARMEAGGRQRCEDAPQEWPQRRSARSIRSVRPRDSAQMRRSRSKIVERRRARRRARHERRESRRGHERQQVFAYDDAFLSSNPDAPGFDPELISRLEHELTASRIVTGSREYLLSAVRMPWTDGPCAVVLVRSPVPPYQRNVWRSAVPTLLIALAAALLAVFAAGPMVRRIRRLTHIVRDPDDQPERLESLVQPDDEIGELAVAFQNNRRAIAAQVAELSAREKSLVEYLANTTHDVMLPLTVLQGHLVAILKKDHAGEPAGHEQCLGALEEAHYIASLLHNLGAAARLDAGVAVIDAPVDLNAVVLRVVARHRIIADEQDIELDSAVPELPLRVRGDITLIEQALSNVVHNAVRCNRPGGHVAVVLEKAEGAKNKFMLHVLDDGPGVPESQLAKLTARRFRGADARSRRPAGSGLGLAIAQEVADRQGWTLRLSAVSPSGLEVSFEGPLLAISDPRS